MFGSFGWRNWYVGIGLMLYYYLNKGKIIPKSERQTELKNVLFETMKLTEMLKSQLKKLQNCGLVFHQ